MNDAAMRPIQRRKLSSNTPNLRTFCLKPSPCWNRKGAKHVAPPWTLIGLHFDRSFPESFHATPDTRAAARHNLVTVGIEDLKRNCIGEFVGVVTDLDGPREPMRLRPGSSGAKNEGLGYCA